MLTVRCILLGGSLAMAGWGAAVHGAERQIATSVFLEQANELAGALEDTSIGYWELRQIGDRILSIEIGLRGENGWEERRQLKVALWFRAMVRLENGIDAGFNADDYHNQIVISPGVDGMQIAGRDLGASEDPDVRRKYEEAKDLNRIRMEYFNEQLRRRKLKSIWLEWIVNLVSSSYDPPDAEELAELEETLHREVGIPSLRKELAERFEKTMKDER